MSLAKTRCIQRGSMEGSAFIAGGQGVAALVVEEAHHVEGIAKGALGELSRQLQGTRGTPAEQRAVVFPDGGVFFIVYADNDTRATVSVG